MNEWKFNLVGAGTESPFGGYVSEVDKTTLSRRFLVKGSKNVYIKNSGTVAVRPGVKRRGSADTTEAGVLSSVEWDTSLGTVRALRVCNGKLEVESDIVSSGTYVWYTLLSGLTNTRLIFDTWWDNSAKKDILLFCDGTDTMRSWSGGIGTIVSTTATTIVFSSNAVSLGFKSGGGTVIINGTEYAYTGVSTTSLTGVTGDPTGKAAGSVVLQKPEDDADTVEANFKIDFIKVVNNQLYANSETSRLVYVSKNNNWTDFSYSSPRAPGEGDIITLDEVPTGIGMRNGKAHIATKKAWYEISFNKIVISNTLSEQTQVDRKPMALKKGALRHEFIDNVGDDLIYLSQDQQLTLYGTLPNINDPQFPSLSEDIKTELKNEDFTGGHMRAVGDFIYLVSPNNGRLWIHETITRVDDNGNVEKRKIWHPPFIVSFSRIAVIDGTVYGHSNSRPQIYQLWDTLQWHDDSPTDDYIPYDSVAVFSYRHGNRYDLLGFDKIYFEGYMTPGSPVYGAATYEYQGERATQQLILNGENVAAEFFVGDVGVSLGDSSIGDNPLGDQVSDEERDQDLVPKFRVVTDVGVQHVFEYQVRVYSTDLDARWELLCFGANEIIVEDKPVSLRV